MTQISGKIQTIGGRQHARAALAPTAAIRPVGPEVVAGASSRYNDLRLLKPWRPDAFQPSTAQPAPAVAPRPLAAATQAPTLPTGRTDIPETGQAPPAAAVFSPQATAPAPAPVAAPIAPAPALPTPIVVPVAPAAPVPPPPPLAPPAPPPAPIPLAEQVRLASAIENASNDQAAYEAALKLMLEALESRHNRPERKADDDGKSDAGAIQRLKDLKPEELARLGQTDKKGFFAIMRPAAEEAERKYGVPAAITLAQAALETGWGKHIIPGFNVFGIKGKGPAGTVSKGTWEVYGGKKVNITANFAKYHNFYEAVEQHGKLFHNGYYTKAMEQFKRDRDPFAFARNITGTYATDPSYGSKLSSIIRDYGLA